MMSIAYLVFFLATFPFAMIKNRLFGFYYAALYIYSAFSIAGYLYLPGVSESLSAYFGDSVGYKGLLFTFSSMAAFWSVNMFIYRPAETKPAWILADHSESVTPIGTAVFIGISLIFAGLLAFNFSSLSWYIFEETDSLPLQTSLFIAVYKMMVGVLAIGYVLLRSDDILCNRAFTGAYALVMIVFLVASVKLGNRTDPAALMIGITMYETITRRLNVKSLLLVGVTLLLAVLALSVVEYYRYTDTGIQAPLLERIVRNDYYAPAHMLFAAIAFDFVDPLTVIRSNSANAMILFGEPYLQQTITELFRSNIATRSAGYAFYIMTEGWMFAGWGGIIYNAVVLSTGLWLWNRLASTSNRLVNVLSQVLVACMLLNVTRGQSSYFIKYLYTFILPNMALALLLAKLRFELPGQHVVLRATTTTDTDTDPDVVTHA